VGHEYTGVSRKWGRIEGGSGRRSTGLGRVFQEVCYALEGVQQEVAEYCEGVSRKWVRNMSVSAGSGSGLELVSKKWDRSVRGLAGSAQECHGVSTKWVRNVRATARSGT